MTRCLTKPSFPPHSPLPALPFRVPAVTCSASFLLRCRRTKAAAKAHRQKDRERHLESWSGTKGVRNSKRGELFKDKHQSIREGERAGNDRSGLKSHLSPSSYYVNYSCSLAAAAEVIANNFWKRFLCAKAPGLLPPISQQCRW